MSKPVRRIANVVALALLLPALLIWALLNGRADAAPDPATSASTGSAAADPPPVIIDAPASAPFEHVKTFALPPHTAMPIDLAIAPGGTLFVADGGRIRAVDVIDDGGALIRRELIPASIPVDLVSVVPIALEHDPATGELDIVWQEHGTPPGATEPRFGRAWIERRSAGGEAVRVPGRRRTWRCCGPSRSPGRFASPLTRLRSRRSTLLLRRRWDVVE